jgi:multidrug efflux system outer membrane protein
VNHIRHKYRLAVLLLTGMVAVGGCSTARPYQRPDVLTADAWRMSDSAQASTWPAVDWWHTFESSQLDELITQAQRANFDLAAAVARIRQADAQTRIAGAALLPSVALGTDVSRDRQPARTSSIRGSNTTSTLQEASISASYELDFWGKNQAGVDAARSTALASRYDRDTLELSIDSSIATTYFQILALRDRLDTTKNNIASAESILKILRARLTAGIATALDVAQQETTIATLSATLPALEVQLRQNIDALAILLGELPESFDVTTGTLANVTLPAITPGIPSELLARRPDVAAAESQLVAANADVAAARAAFFPSVQLTVQGGIESAALSSLFGSSSAIFTLAAGLTQPLFEGGRLKGQYQNSQARYDELTQVYKKAVVSAFSDVEDALVATRQTAEQEQRQQDAVTAARHAYDISSAELRAGTVDLLTVLTAQNALFNAEDALVQVRLARLQATVGLIKALGGGWQQTQEISS